MFSILEDQSFFSTWILDFFFNYKQFKPRSFLVLSRALSFTKNSQSVFELGFPSELSFFERDKQALTKNSFDWRNLIVDDIEARSEFIKSLKDINDNDTIYPLCRLGLLDSIPMERLFSLKFIDNITNYPDYQFGLPVYNTSLTFNTYLIDYFVKFYLMRDIKDLEKIDAAIIDTYCPITRTKIREKNRNNAYLRQKYFNDEFNIFKFALKLINKFTLGATWRWVGNTHKAHVYNIKICKILIEYGLLEGPEIEELRQAFYLKIQVYKSLEEIIGKETDIISESMQIWREGLSLIREYYSEFLIHHLFYKQDLEVIAYLQKIQIANRNKEITFNEIEKIVKFNDIKIFEEEFGRKMMDFLFSYILSQNKIEEISLISPKMELISQYFLHIFANVDDPFLQSLKLLNDEDCQEFIARTQLDENSQNDIKTSLNELQIFQKSYLDCRYYYQEERCYQDLIKILKALQIKLDSSGTIGQTFRQVQEFLNKNNFALNLLNMMANLNFINKNTTQAPFKELNNVFCDIIIWYLQKNFGNQSSFFNEDNLKRLLIINDNFPETLGTILFATFSDDPKILTTKEFLLKAIFDILHICVTNCQDNESVENYNIVKNYFSVLNLFLSPNYAELCSWFPEYDLKITTKLIELNYFMNMDIYKSLNLIEKVDVVENAFDSSKLNCFLAYIRCLAASTEHRYLEATFKISNEKFSIDGVIELINLCENNLQNKFLFLDLYSHIHINFKDYLLDNRSDYYHTEPKDDKYEEDAYAPHDYSKTIDFLTEQLLFVLEIWKKREYDQTDFTKYMNDGVYMNIAKLMRLFLLLKEDEVYKIKEFLEQLEKMLRILDQEKTTIKGMYGLNEEEMDLSPSEELQKLNDRMAETDQFQTEKDRTHVFGVCQAIVDIINKILKCKPLEKKTIFVKYSVGKGKDSYEQMKSFSNKMQLRKQSLKNPFASLFENQQKNQTNISVSKSITAFYQNYKMKKMSVDENFYIKSLEDSNNKEIQTLTYNLCYFIFTQMNTTWEWDTKGRKYTLIETLINNLFISTLSIQNSLFKIFEIDGWKLMDNLWIEVRNYLQFVKFKTTLDRVWDEAFKRLILLFNFHQFLCEDNNSDFKDQFALRLPPDDTVHRTERFSTIVEKICDNFDWHQNYNKTEVTRFKVSHREYLFPIAKHVFDNMAEVCTGPNPKCQESLYRYIFDRYNGILNRFVENPNHEFYSLKLSLVEFMLAVIEGLNEDVLSYHCVNFEIALIFNIIINTIRQLYYCVGLGRKELVNKSNISDYGLKLSDYKKIVHFYESSSEFSGHVLMDIAFKLFSYLKIISSVRSKYKLFFNERDKIIKALEKSQKATFTAISEEEIVVFKFLQFVLLEIEVVRENTEELVIYYFKCQSKNFYLSAGAKSNFLKTVDRSSAFTKHIGLLNETEYFQLEMLHNEQHYKKNYFLYKVFGGGEFYIQELLCLTLCLLINMLLLTNLDPSQNSENEGTFEVGYSTTVKVLGIIEIVISGIAMIGWMYLIYPLTLEIEKLRYLDQYAYKRKLNPIDVIYVGLYKCFIQQKVVIVFLYHILFVVLGLTVSYGFFGIDLLSIISVFTTMQSILASVTQKFRQLLITLIMAAIIMFAYTIFVMLYFNDFMIDSSCNNLSHCYWNIIDNAFTNGSGVVSLLQPMFYGKGGDGRFYGKLILDVSFFLLINTVLLNIILAILVDTFSNLRQRDDEFSKY